METQSKTVHRKRIGELLVEAGILTDEQLPVGLKEAQQRSVRLGEVLVMLRYLSAEDLERVLQAQTKLEDGTVSDARAVVALRYASKNQTTFDEALAKTETASDNDEAETSRELERLHDQLKKAERFGNSREVAAVSLQAGEIYLRCGRHDDAEKSFKRALQSFERSFGQRHLKVANCQSKLADLYFRQGKYDEAETLYWRVLDITQSAWGNEHIEVANCHKSLARLLEAQGKLKEAEQFYLSALRILEKVAGTNSPELTDGLRLLAAFWRKQGKKPEHKRLGDLCVEAGLLRPEQLQATLMYCQQGRIPVGQGLVQQGHLTREMLRPVLQAQLLVGDGVLPVQIATRALATTSKGKTFEEALREFGWEPDSFTTDELLLLITTAEDLFSAEASLGSEHPSVGVLSSKLADLYTGQKKYAEAEPLYKRALAISEKVFGARDLEVATAAVKLANLYVHDGNPLEAENLLWRALEIRQTLKGADDPDVADCLDLLGMVQERQENFEPAQRFYQSALAIKEKKLGRAHLRTAETIQRLADVLYRQQKFDEAEPFYVRLIRVRQKELGTLDPSLLPTLQRLGELYVAKKDYANAETQFELALEIHEQTAASSQLAAEVLEKFSVLLANTGRKAESEKILEKARIVKRIRA